ncbi:MAG: hypothetical protein UV99_C0002G0024 [Parcubacteria group bacterium GW2011_GWC1_43_61]|nr:MAG: hypothetical protein UV99_C0002G0024 [Parcubacteria group bacterium GW2011_GWC1_43_61]OGD41311.1 MAG: hypothetical protein A3K28_02085 [Candidatus Azambacteria bacterium RIFOXYB1_FULL_40_33]HAJ44818.1 hypothetical protein [Candidatus Azambacteria bacterium]HAN61848.1 hypothetical protein [Candidatus Azambacteria bacterium]HAX38770.1 hypothetical protein [Candidatus Azambacteria bacterium]
MLYIVEINRFFNNFIKRRFGNEKGNIVGRGYGVFLGSWVSPWLMRPPLRGGLWPKKALALLADSYPGSLSMNLVTKLWPELRALG